ncbi:MAG: hypothetical protein AAGA85_02820 [Bacteroidota bacterium]
MMKILSGLRSACVTRGNMQAFYESLTREQLRERKISLRNQYLLPIGIWGLTIVLMTAIYRAEPELLFLYAATAIPTMIALIQDYRRRKRLIEKILQER